MAFFRGQRPDVYLHGAKLRRDKKTGKRLWSLTLIVTLSIDYVLSCGDQVESCYGYILKLENGAVDVMLNLIVPDCHVAFYALIDDAIAKLQLDHVEIDGFRMTRDKEVAELWFHFEVENSLNLHAFVKEFAFTRFWAEFKPAQGELVAMTPAAQGELIKGAKVPKKGKK